MPNRLGWKIVVAAPTIKASLAPFTVVIVLLVGVCPATALSNRRAGLENARMLGEAETLAEACPLVLDQTVAKGLSSEVLSKIDGSSFYSMEKFAQAYTLNDLKHDKTKTCAWALDQFGSNGEQVRDLLRAP